MNILVDYLTVSLRGYKLNELLNILKVKQDDMQEIKSFFAFCGMERCWYLPKGIKVHEGEYLILEMSGQGCRLLESIHGADFDWLSLIGGLLSEEGTHISRLDIAADDKEGILSMSTMRRYIEERRFICKARRCVIMSGSEEMIVFGSGQSDRRLRIYNKALERGREGEHWIRVEMQMRDDAALSYFMRAFERNDIGEVFSGMLYDYLRFTSQKNTDNHTERKTVVRWWQKFVNTTEKIKGFYIGGLEYNSEGLRRFIKVGAGSSIKTFLELTEGDVGQLFELVQDCKLNKRQRFLIQTTLRERKMHNDYNGYETCANV